MCDFVLQCATLLFGALLCFSERDFDLRCATLLLGALLCLSVCGFDLQCVTLSFNVRDFGIQCATLFLFGARLACFGVTLRSERAIVRKINPKT